VVKILVNDTVRVFWRRHPTQAGRCTVEREDAFAEPVPTWLDSSGRRCPRQGLKRAGDEAAGVNTARASTESPRQTASTSSLTRVAHGGNAEGRSESLENQESAMDLRALTAKLRDFASECDWDQFHTTKNLAIGLAVEAAELLEIFQWLTDEQVAAFSNSPEGLNAVRDELADVFIYVVRLADKLTINLEDAVARKLNQNADKYPVNLAKGNATKYSRRRS
jgi:NTP pyrophosphatase (non-canonical NTP hydrolase)